MLIRFSITLFIFLSSLTVALAQQCSAIFPDAVQNNNASGYITFQQDAQVFNSPDNILASNNNVIDNAFTLLTCDTVNCTHSGSSATSFNYNNIPNSNTNISVGYQQSLALAPGNYKNISLATRAELILTPGDYTLSGYFTSTYQNKIIIDDSANPGGVVRILVKGSNNVGGGIQQSILIANESEINLTGSTKQLLLYAKSDIALQYRAKLNGFIYSDKDVNIDNEVTVTGAISGKNVTLNYKSNVTFSNVEPDFGDVCSNGVQPIANYRFDECEYTGAAFEVIDQTGSFPASTYSSVNTFEFGQLERSIELTSKDHHIETSIPVPTNFSVSTWFKKPNITTGSRYFVLGSVSGGGDLLYLDRNRNYRWGIYNPSTGARNGRYTFGRLDNNWHHMALLYSNGTTQLYIDGVYIESVGRAPTGTIKYIGTSYDGVTGNNAQGFRSPLDEFMVFDQVLTADEIQTIYNNQSAGKNYDGSTRTPVSCLGIIADYRLDEISWNSTPNEVVSQTGILHGQAYGGSTTSRTLPARVGNPGTCGYGEFDGIDDYVEIADNPALDLLDELTITSWIYPKSLPSSGLKTILSKDENYEYHLNTSGELFWWWSTHSMATSGANITPNNWYHVAITYKSGLQRIYINGVKKAESTYTGTLVLNNDPLQIGQDQGFRGRYFYGNIDEVKVYGKALTAAEVNDIYSETHPCSSYIDHFEVNLIDGQGLTCDADDLTIKACADASCSMLNTDATDVALSINGSFHKNVTVVGSTDTTINYTTPGIVSLSLDQTFECINGNPNVCDVTFADTGFRFFADTEGTPIPLQLSGKNSKTGFNASTLKVQAIEKNPDTGVCQAAFINTKSIEMAATCVDPVACAGSNVAIDNLTTTTNINTLNNSSPLTYSNVGLDFSDNTVNSAEFIFTYPDAGKIQLHARYNIPDENGNPTGNYMQGASNAFIVRPLGFYLDVIGNKKAQTANQANSVFQKAGNDFTTTLTAVAWQSGDDVNNDGIPDDSADLSNNAATLNFGQESTPEKAKIIHNLVLPISSHLGSLTHNLFSAFNNGSATVNNMSYDEVGIISFAASLTDNSYLGGSDITGTEPYVGRFIPHHFTIAIDKPGSLASVCEGGDPDLSFAYSGQTMFSDSTKGVIQYLQQPSIKITPQAKLETHTQNYSGDFNKLLLSGITRFQVNSGGTLVDAPIEDATHLGVDGSNKVKLTAHYFDGTLTEALAILNYEYSAEDNFIYTHEQNAEISPFVSDIHLSLASIVDQDGVMANDIDNLGDTGIAGDTIITLIPTGKEIRFGRGYLAQSFGPETSDLPQPFSVQYLNSLGRYVTNEQDTCTPYNSDQIILTSGSLDKNLSGVNTASGYLNDQIPHGETQAMTLTSPGEGNQGNVNVEYMVKSWLQYDWSWDGVSVKSYTENPKAVATFGLFRGNDRIIYQREIR